MLAAPPDVVWREIGTMAGVDAELWPWLRMTAPPGARLDPETVVLGERLFRSRLLLAGVLPVDYDDLTVVHLAPGEFLERSRMLSAPVWEHHRTVVAHDGGSRLSDRVRFEPRLPWASRPHRALVAAVFTHRHRRLRHRFGDAAAGATRAG
ncbi:hypothetical protein [Cellulomonas sp. ATA003]|uniref:hypothetical protein n=1 Tax=Cellulomonas sp. ATA003 TaxID=3073064 RepID=UPI0028735147|nr:hypothetical protein [Cellulomonas sp. ATA003]WNB87208.1 hypothetical protein REH70_08935 [Cellulomonas sp. ATA003]